MIYKQSAFIVILLGLFLSFSPDALAQKKRRKKDSDPPSVVGKAYQNMTAQYNGYFNANELYLAAKANLSSKMTDYSQQLPIFRHLEAVENGQKTDLKEAIKKLSKVIHRRRKSDWVDDGYLLMGKCRILMREFEEAQQAFLFLEQDYSPEAVKKRYSRSKKGRKLAKKEREEARKRKKSGKEPDEEKPDRYILKHRPINQEAKLELILAYTLMSKFDDASVVINELERDKKTFPYILVDLLPVKAFYYLKKGNVQESIENLKLAIDEKYSNRQERARLSFLVGQLSQKVGDQSMAATYFEKAKSLSNDYNLAFFANLNALKDNYYADKLSGEDALKELKRLSRDSKNSDLMGHLDYTAAIINLDQRNLVESKKFFKKALANPDGSFKLNCYYELGRLYYNDDVFVEARAYYDSTLSIIPKTDDRFYEVKTRVENLTEIASLMAKIQEQDSLLKISQMTDEERVALAKEIRKQEELARLRSFNASTNAIKQASGDPNRTSTFFAYNEKSVRKGSREFEKIYGDIPLVDNWLFSSLIETNGTEGEEDFAQNSINEQVLDDVFAGVPDTPEEIQASKTIIKKALPDLGFQFRDVLERNDLTVQTLEGRLLEEFEDIEEKEKVWYYLYLAHTDLGQNTKAEKYKALLTKNTNSKYAQAILNPGALDKQNADLELQYEEAYSLFKKEKVEAAKRAIQQNTEKLSPSDPLMPKFALLNALCIGKLEGLDSYKEALTNVSNTYPVNVEGIRAKEMLRLLDTDVASGSGSKTGSDSGEANIEEIKDSPFKVDNDGVHYAMILIDSEKKNISSIKSEIAKFNRQTPDFQKFRVTNIYLGTAVKKPIIIVRKMNNKADAMKYYNAITAAKDTFIESATDYTVYVITQDNYKTILRARGVDGYDAFFKAAY